MATKKRNRSEKRAKKQSSRRAPFVLSGRNFNLAKGQKRTAKQLETVMDRLFKFLNKNKNVGIEFIGRGLGMKTSELTLPMHKLIAAKEVRKRGLKRASKYSVR